MIELLLFVALAGIFYVIIIQMIPKKRSGQDVHEFFLSLNSLCALATQEALCKQTQATLEFKKSSKNAQWQVRAKILDNIDLQGKKNFKAIQNGFVQNKFLFPKNINLVKWWTDQGKAEEAGENFEINISSRGICQYSILHLVEINAGVEKKYSAIINPFLAKFEQQIGFCEVMTQ